MSDEGHLDHLAEVEGDTKMGVDLALLPSSTIKWLSDLRLVSHALDFRHPIRLRQHDGVLRFVL
ncbi:MAG: hypothetical protein ACM3N0_06640 [Chloroflexota bacterium]